MEDVSALEELRLEVEELRASRARVLAAADAERRWIERELHDGAQQHLVALVVNLQLARDLASGDPLTLKDLLNEVASDARDALESVRALAYRVYPPLLRDRGVAEAVRATAVSSGVRAGVTSTCLGRFPPDVETTLYFSCVKALDVLSEHAGPYARLTIGLSQDGESVSFAVAVDVVAPDVNGAELITIRDRVATVGGDVTLSCDGRSSTISGRIPLAA
jgi:signal transduction histidine kinase